MADQPDPPIPRAEDSDDRIRQWAYRVLWAASLVICPVTMVVVAIISTSGPRPEDGLGQRDAFVSLDYLLGLHFLLSCFAAWAAFTIWKRWWLVGWGVVLLAGLATVVVTVGVSLEILYG